MKIKVKALLISVGFGLFVAGGINYCTNKKFKKHENLAMQNIAKDTTVSKQQLKNYSQQVSQGKRTWQGIEFDVYEKNRASLQYDIAKSPTMTKEKYVNLIKDNIFDIKRLAKIRDSLMTLKIDTARLKR